MSGGGETTIKALEAAGYQLMTLAHPNGICCDKGAECETCKVCDLIDEALTKLCEPERAAEPCLPGDHYHCTNGHASHMVLKSEALGRSACLAANCMAPLDYCVEPPAAAQSCGACGHANHGCHTCGQGEPICTCRGLAEDCSCEPAAAQGAEPARCRHGLDATYCIACCCAGAPVWRCEQCPTQSEHTKECHDRREHQPEHPAVAALRVSVEALEKFLAHNLTIVEAREALEQAARVLQPKEPDGKANQDPEDYS